MYFPSILVFRGVFKIMTYTSRYLISTLGKQTDVRKYLMEVSGGIASDIFKRRDTDQYLTVFFHLNTRIKLIVESLNHTNKTVTITLNLHSTNIIISVYKVLHLLTLKGKVSLKDK